MVAAAVGAAAVVGGVVSSNASKSAANSQSKAAKRSADMQMEQYNQTRSDLQPYMQAGQNALSQFQNYINTNQYLNGNKQFSASGLPWADSNGSFNFNPSDLTSTPGYQFTLQQGTRGVNNSASARGLGLSGAQLKGIADYTTGLADNTYNQQFSNALNQYNSSFNNALSTFNTNYNTAANQANRLSGIASLGENAAAQSGNYGTQAASNAGSLNTQGANAIAAGQMGSANAISGAVNGVSNAFLLNSLLNQSGSRGLYG